MGSDCQSSLLINVSVSSATFQWFPLLGLVGFLGRPSVPRVHGLRNMTMVPFFVLMWISALVSLQAAPDLWMMLVIPKLCSSNSGGKAIASDWVYIVLWIFTGLRLLICIGIMAGVTTMILFCIRFPAEFYRGFIPKPWFDRKKRAALLQKLIRCAGTKEGCRLLTEEYCNRTFAWSDMLDHPIVLSYLFMTYSQDHSQRIHTERTLKLCPTCSEPIKPKESIFLLHPPNLEELTKYHLDCVTTLEKAQLRHLLQNERVHIDSMETYTKLERVPDPPDPKVTQTTVPLT